MAPARIIILIALTVAMNLTYLLASALKSLHNYFCCTIVTNVLPRKNKTLTSTILEGTLN